MGGMLAGTPHQGGATWAVLQYILGLRALGHEVYVVEPVGSDQIRPVRARLRESVNARYFESVVRRYGLQDVSTLVDRDTRESVGLPYGELPAIAAKSDLLINISGLIEFPDVLGAVPTRLYLDLDPGFTQVWHSQGIGMRLEGHTHFATVGQAIGRPGCIVPDCGLHWIRTLQPVSLPDWPVSTRIRTDALTTVGHWRSYGSVEYQGLFMGQRVHSMRPFLGLAGKTSRSFSLAMAIHPDETADIAALRETGWRILDPMNVASTPWDYREFIRGSAAEFGIAKKGYVLSRCGWFSDRSACYLASGRPVIAQDTGFPAFIPTGEGLFSFDSEAGALAAIGALDSDYVRHARAARRLAEDYFDSEKVLPLLLGSVGGGSSALTC